MIEKKNNITLRPTVISDLKILFEFQLNEDGRYLAAFMSNDSTNQEAYIDKYTRLLSNPLVNNQTILINQTIAGSIAKFEIDGEAEITYWIDKKYWNLGIATFALEKFLGIELNRPIIARVAFDNLGSQNVLEKNCFVKIGHDIGFSYIRQKEIEEFIYKLS